MKDKISLYTFKNLVKGVFIERENRFLASVEIMEKNKRRIVKAHVHDPGRLKELLYKNNSVLMRFVRNQTRKTAWEVVFANLNNKWVLVNTIFHSEIANRIFNNNYIKHLISPDEIKKEVPLNDSRIDFLLKFAKKEIWVEVKGCTLVKNHIALFPDAITKRGKKHFDELRKVVENGGQAAVLFLIFNEEATGFKPYGKNDPEFAKSFYAAKKAGVNIFPALIKFDNNFLYFYKLLKIL
ncbi:DNA/RNA nuclease SfsA [bacterium]|nr:DNA/RNA nuclease SfsA [bacterium]